MSAQVGTGATVPILLHTSCLQDDPSGVPLGPGDYSVLLVEAFDIHGPPGTGIIRLKEWDVLVGEQDVPDLRDATARHLAGRAGVSELRLGVGLLLGHPPHLDVDGLLTDHVVAEIDAWIRLRTAFAFITRPEKAEPTGVGMAGFFNGVARSWNGMHPSET